MSSSMPLLRVTATAAAAAALLIASVLSGDVSVRGRRRRREARPRAGPVSWQGRPFVDAIGARTAKIDRTKARALIAYATAMCLGELAPVYTRGVVDADGEATAALTIGGKTKQVTLARRGRQAAASDGRERPLPPCPTVLT